MASAGSVATTTEVQPVPTTLGSAADPALSLWSARPLPGPASSLGVFDPDASVTFVPGGGLKPNADALGVDGSKEVKPTSKEGSWLFFANTWTRIGTWVSPSIAMRTESTSDPASLGCSTSS